MTNEQREAIELVEYIADNTWTTKYIMSSDSKKADAVLSLIKEQEKQIENTTENYKNLIEDISMLAKELGLEDDATIDEIYTAIRILKSKRINVIEQLDCIEKKDREIEKLEKQSKVIDRQAQKYFEQTIYLNKIIDLMADIFYKRFKAELLLEYGFESKEELKQYFERKVENER